MEIIGEGALGNILTKCFVGIFDDFALYRKGWTIAAFLTFFTGMLVFFDTQLIPISDIRLGDCLSDDMVRTFSAKLFSMTFTMGITTRA